jgi:hypothetical protein
MLEGPLPDGDRHLIIVNTEQVRVEALKAWPCELPFTRERFRYKWRKKLSVLKMLSEIFQILNILDIKPYFYTFKF